MNDDILGIATARRDALRKEVDELETFIRVYRELAGRTTGAPPAHFSRSLRLNSPFRDRDAKRFSIVPVTPTASFRFTAAGDDGPLAAQGRPLAEPPSDEPTE